MLLLFAQAGRNNNANGADAAALVFVLAFYGGIILAFLVPQIFFLLTMSRALKHCHPKHRTMEPGMVWLNLVPLLNIVWHFLTVIRISESLKREFRYRRLRSHDDFGQTLGIITCGLLMTCGCIGLICGIIYWVKIAEYNRVLASSSRDDNWDDEDEDDEDSWDEDDDRPRRRRRESEDEEGDDRPRRRRRESEDEEEDDRPRKRRREAEDEEGDDRPRKRRTEYGDHEDEHLR